MSDLYYKIIGGCTREDGNEYVTVVTMQWFDEYDYNQDRFFRDEDGDTLMFYEEDEAIQWLFDNVKEEYIDPEYRGRRFNQSKYMK
ncbi:hypothetical protein BSP36_172 [Bacillus phage BSP36]|uniref:Uncharacterized protein n=1 Tax=Bacillus phage BSP38 TaxID=2283013 RepID=A0A345MK35_BPBSP|nr:hypothetical protein HWB82_gp143 [Bacillus phage BSP38]AXH71217.1 hypothetical protein BSP38_175 [Bacillus phage BSP38]AYJ75259.1 hypothetical protein BSP36_172 [Bacillus phage BSP36]